ncbi:MULTISPECIES: MFS transporter [Sphingobium]|uniref:MFS transporter n=1 Tax=Sphingobium TaxID=165695 RepID=UPI000A7EDF63|nr:MULTISPECIES: MFS transporter [Sphingobium]MCC4256266.1 MFS transporter [Sphingobium lactosutens]MEC9016431.1 MFS transporter [Pseudomonadota bacterium]
MAFIRKDAQHDQILLFCVMLCVAIGNTGLQSVLPAIGRTIGLPDALIAIAFSLSALLWAVVAPFWARRLDDRRAKPMILVGMAGFTLSMTICALALTAGVRGWITAGVAFILFVIGRGFYGGFGAAAPPAAQAMVVARTSRANRTAALSLLASAFGLGTIIGPALAPFFVLPFVGLAGPLYAFALLGIAMLVVVQLRLPQGMGTGPGAAASDPVIGYEPSDAPVIATGDPTGTARVAMFDPRIRPWIIAGLVSGHAQAIAGQTMAFLVIDRLADSPREAQPLIGMVLMAGAGAALLAQWGIIPRLRMQPPPMAIWGSVMAAAGAAGCAVAHDLHALAIAFAIASLGFGFLRPGFTAGASLAVREQEQGLVAGHVTAVNGLCFVLGPSIGIGLYQIGQPLPYLLCAGVMAGLAGYCHIVLGRLAREG